MANDLILEKLEYLTTKVDKIEDAVQIIAVQSNRLDTLDRDVGALWKSKAEYGKEMVEIQKFQASCPRREIGQFIEDTKDTVNRQWVAIGILFAGLLGVAGWIKLGG